MFALYRNVMQVTQTLLELFDNYINILLILYKNQSLLSKKMSIKLLIFYICFVHFYLCKSVDKKTNYSSSESQLGMLSLFYMADKTAIIFIFVKYSHYTIE